MSLVVFCRKKESNPTHTPHPPNHHSAAAVEDVKAKDEDAALNTLAAAWLVLHDGSEDHVEDCYFSLQELCDQFGQTAMLLTLMGSCKMLLGIGAMSDGELGMHDSFPVLC